MASAAARRQPSGHGLPRRAVVGELIEEGGEVGEELARTARGARRAPSGSSSSLSPRGGGRRSGRPPWACGDRRTGSATAVAVRLRRVGPSTVAERSLGARSAGPSGAWPGATSAAGGAAGDVGDAAGQPWCAPRGRAHRRAGRPRAGWPPACRPPPTGPAGAAGTRGRCRRCSRRRGHRSDASFSSAMASAASGSLRLKVPPKPQQRWASSSGQGTTEQPSTAATAARVRAATPELAQRVARLVHGDPGWWAHAARGRPAGHEELGELPRASGHGPPRPALGVGVTHQAEQLGPVVGDHRGARPGRHHHGGRRLAGPRLSRPHGLEPASEARATRAASSTKPAFHAGCPQQVCPSGHVTAQPDASSSREAAPTVVGENTSATHVRNSVTSFVTRASSRVLEAARISASSSDDTAASQNEMPVLAGSDGRTGQGAAAPRWPLRSSSGDGYLRWDHISVPRSPYCLLTRPVGRRISCRTSG